MSCYFFYLCRDFVGCAQITSTCLRRPPFFQQLKKGGKESRPCVKLKFCSAFLQAEITLTSPCGSHLSACSTRPFPSHPSPHSNHTTAHPTCGWYSSI